MSMKQATSAPMTFRVTRKGNVKTFHVEVRNVELVDDDKVIATKHSGAGASWREAKFMFWDAFKAQHPNVYLTPRDQ